MLHGIAAVALLFVCVLLHELAHAIQARAIGWHVYGITLTPLGGVAQVSVPPSQPLHELTVAIAGPAANLGLAILLGAAAYAVQPFDPLQWPQYLLTDFPTLRGSMLYLFAINAMLFATNMLPVFPMDGAQMARAVLKMMGVSRLSATRVVAGVGWGVALLLVMLGARAAFRASPALALLFVLLASVVYFGARQEIRKLHRQRALTHMRVGHVRRTESTAAAPDDLLSQVITQRAFKQADVIPVLRRGKLIGLLVYQQARQAAGRSPQATVAHAMQVSFPILAPHDTLISALGQMTESDIPSLPVEAEGRYAGMLSLMDVERALQRFDPSSH